MPCSPTPPIKPGAVGYADFSLIAYHFERVAIASPPCIPTLYAAVMGVDALAALLFGRWFDQSGLAILSLAALLSAFFAPLVFGGGFGLALTGMVLWGISGVPGGTGPTQGAVLHGGSRTKAQRS